MRITARGVAVIIASLILAGGGLWVGIVEFVMLGIIGLTLAFVSLFTVAAATHPNRIKVSRQAPTQISCGQRRSVLVQISAKTKLNDGVLIDLSTPEINASSAHTQRRGSTLELKYTINPSKSGYWRLGPLLWQKSDAFGLWVVKWHLGQINLVEAWPKTVPLLVASTFPPPKVTAGKLIGASPDDVTLRDYVPGDDLRRIHWPTTARRGTPMVRENEGRAKTAVRVLIDPALLRNQKTREWALEHGASVACSALDLNHQIEIVGSSQTDFIDCQITGRNHILSEINRLAAAHPVAKNPNNSFNAASALPPANSAAAAKARNQHLITYAIVSSNFPPKPATAADHNYVVVVGNTGPAKQAAENFKKNGWQVAHLAKPGPHQSAWNRAGVLNA